MLLTEKCFVLLGLAALGLSFPAPACAYLDAGTGSMILQVAVAAFFGAIFTLKIYWKKVKIFCSGLFKKSN